MAAPLRKKISRNESISEAITPNYVVDHLIYITPQKIQKRRREIMSNNSEEKGFKVVEEFSCSVSHIASACDTRDQAIRFLHHDEELWCDDVLIVHTDWLSECLRLSKIVDVQQHHLLPRDEKKKDAFVDEDGRPVFPVYECQRATPQRHHNHNITDALEILAKAADYKNDDINYSRALAFRRASCVFKSLSAPLISVQQARKLYNIGAHVRRVIQDILNNGFSNEADSIENSDWFRTMSIFTEIFGVGPSKADTWYRLGLRSIAELRREPSLPSMNDMITLGLALHEDLTLPVQRSEAEAVKDLVRREVDDILPGCSIVITGGFRRGKETGHDVDLLISHPEEGRERGVLTELLRRLDRRGLVIDGTYSKNEWNSSKIRGEGTKGQYLRSTLDHFEKWVGILKLDKRHRRSDDQGKREKMVTRPGADGRWNSQDAVQSGVNVDENSRVEGFVGVNVAGNSQAAEVSGMGADWNSQDGPLRRSPRKLSSSTQGALTSLCLARTGSLDSLDTKPSLKRKASIASIALESNSERLWYARRVDLIISPASQYYYALVGWTGSKQFNRSLRWYAQRDLGMKLTSHVLYDTIQKQILPANSEKEVFDNLRVTHRDPTDRNC